MAIGLKPPESPLTMPPRLHAFALYLTVPAAMWRFR